MGVSCPVAARSAAARIHQLEVGAEVGTTLGNLEGGQPMQQESLIIEFRFQPFFGDLCPIFVPAPHSYEALAQHMGCGAAMTGFPLTRREFSLVQACTQNGDVSAATEHKRIQHGKIHAEISNVSVIYFEDGSNGPSCDDGSKYNEILGVFYSWDDKVRQAYAQMILSPKLDFRCLIKSEELLFAGFCDGNIVNVTNPSALSAWLT